MLTKEFWENRAKTYGHTGFADPFLYCFDQEARKFAVDTILKENNIRNVKNALDFGCGTGDFFEVLQNYAEKIIGYDISETVIAIAKRRFDTCNNIHLTNDSNDIQNHIPLDLVLTVTVFQRLTREELKQNLAIISSCMCNQSYMACIEFFKFEYSNEKDDAGYITCAEWLNMIEGYGLKLIKTYSFYNAHMHPSVSWKQYSRLKILKPFRHTKIVQRLLTSIAKRLINKEKDVLTIPNDMYKIYLLQRR